MFSNEGQDNNCSGCDMVLHTVNAANSVAQHRDFSLNARGVSFHFSNWPFLIDSISRCTGVANIKTFRKTVNLHTARFTYFNHLHRLKEAHFSWFENEQLLFKTFFIYNLRFRLNFGYLSYLSVWVTLLLPELLQINQK